MRPTKAVLLAVHLIAAIVVTPSAKAYEGGVPTELMLYGGTLQTEGGLWIKREGDTNSVGFNGAVRANFGAGIEAGLATEMIPTFSPRALGIPLAISPDFDINDIQLYGGAWLSSATLPTFLGVYVNLPLENDFGVSVAAKTAVRLTSGVYFLGQGGVGLWFPRDYEKFGPGVTLGIYAELAQRVALLTQMGFQYFLATGEGHNNEFDIPLRIKGIYHITHTLSSYLELVFTDLKDDGGDSLLLMMGVSLTAPFSR